MKVSIPDALRSYTTQAEIEISVAAFHTFTLDSVLLELDRRYPGIRFRMVDEQNAIRPHIRFFVNGEMVRDLTQPLCDSDELFIVQALSGG
jgi:molybdopterin synthase sulfur carrier subunit